LHGISIILGKNIEKVPFIAENVHVESKNQIAPFLSKVSETKRLLDKYNYI
jgi:hypothetical protein